MLNLNQNRLVDLVEDIYEQSAEDRDWEARLVKTVTEVTNTDAAVFFRFESHYNRQGAFGLQAVGSSTRFGSAAAWNDATVNAILHSPAQEQSFGRTQACTFTEASGLGRSVAQMPGWRDCWDAPIVDSLGLIARNADGRGVCFCVGLSRLSTTTKRQRSMLSKIAMHLSTADRLRRAKHLVPLDDAEAILTPSGKILHAVDLAKNKADSLDDGRRRRDEARKAKHDPEQAIEVWKGLVAGRWSLVDHFDTDGKRFLLAMKNPPHVDRRADLTPRERRVSALVAMGHRDKEIAYMLGLSLASVTASIHRARAKLSVATRSELATTWRRGG